MSQTAASSTASNAAFQAVNTARYRAGRAPGSEDTAGVIKLARDATGVPQTADIHAQQQLPPVVCEARQQHRRRYIADDLAGEHAGQQGAALQQTLEKPMNGRQPSQVSGYHEEADEGAQQAHIQLPQQSRFHCGQRPKHQNRQQTIGQNAEHRQQAQQEQCAVQGQLPGLPQGLRVHRRDLEIPGQDRQGRRGQAGQTDPRQGSTTGKKSPAESP